MRSFLVRKINNFTKTVSLRAKVPNTSGARLYTAYNDKSYGYGYVRKGDVSPVSLQQKHPV